MEGDVKSTASNTAVMSKKYLEDFVASCRDMNDRRDRGVRKAARLLGISHQRLMYLLETDGVLEERSPIIEKIRKHLKLSKSAMYDELFTKK